MIPTPPKPGTGSPGGMTNRYDGAGFAANGTPIAGDPRMRGQRPASSGGNFSAYSPGQAQPQQNPYGSSTPYGGKPQSMVPQGTQGGTNQQQTRRQPTPPQYTPQGGPYGAQYGVQRPLVQPPAPAQQYGGYTPSDSGVDFREGEDGQIRDPRYRQPAAGSPGPSQPGRYMPPPGGQPQLSGMLAHDAPWWAGEMGNLPHAPGDNRPAYLDGRPTGANASNWMNQGPSQPGLPAGGGQMIEPPDWFAPGGGGGVPLKPGMAQPSQDSYGTATGYGKTHISPGLIDPNAGLVHYAGDGRPRFAPGQIDPNVANNPYANRPPPFQQTTQNLDGTQSEMPNNQQRDAFISQINNQLGQMQNQSWQQPGMGAPQFNFPQMLGQAGEMAQQGWQNPFAAQGGSESQIRNLLQGDIRPEALGQPGLMSGLPPGATLDSRPAIPRSLTYAQPGGGWGHTPTQPSPQTGYGPTPFPVLKRAPQADSNLTPRQKSEKFLAANQEAIKKGTFRHSDIDALGLSGPEARLLKNKATVQGRSWERLRKADETAKLFPQLERGLNQLYAGYGRR